MLSFLVSDSSVGHWKKNKGETGRVEGGAHSSMRYKINDNKLKPFMKEHSTC